ncbi:MAG TPA: hypothetical protein VGG03_02775, partial [Thermoanaerobaculia bacterium]
MTERTPVVHLVTLLVFFALMPSPRVRASSFVTPGPPLQRLWVRDALTGVAVPQARAIAVGRVRSLATQAWADPSGRLRLFPSARLERIDVFAAGYHSATVAPSPVAGPTTTVWLMPMKRPMALRPDVIAARRLPGTTLLHGYVVSVGSGRPMTGASVRLAGTDIRTTTDEEGYFLIYAKAPCVATPQPVPGCADLVISAPGYISVRLTNIARIEEGSHYIV